METKTIFFNAADIRSLIADAVKARYRSPLLSELDDPRIHNGGVVKRDAKGEVDVRSIDYSAVPPRLWLVKDSSGIYMLSNAKPELSSIVADPAFARAEAQSTAPVISQADADRLLGKSRVWLALPTELLSSPAWRTEGAIAVEISHKKVSLLERMRRRLVEAFQPGETVPTAFISINR